MSVSGAQFDVRGRANSSSTSTRLRRLRRVSEQQAAGNRIAAEVSGRALQGSSGGAVCDAGILSTVSANVTGMTLTVTLPPRLNTDINAVMAALTAAANDVNTLRTAFCDVTLAWFGCDVSATTCAAAPFPFAAPDGSSGLSGNGTTVVSPLFSVVVLEAPGVPSPSPSPAAQPSSGGISSSLAVGLGVGLGLGGAALISLVAYLVLKRRGAPVAAGEDGKKGGQKQRRVSLAGGRGARLDATAPLPASLVGGSQDAGNAAVGPISNSGASISTSATTSLPSSSSATMFAPAIGVVHMRQQQQQQQMAVGLNSARSSANSSRAPSVTALSVLGAAPTAAASAASSRPSSRAHSVVSVAETAAPLPAASLRASPPTLAEVEEQQEESVDDISGSASLAIQRARAALIARGGVQLASPQQQQQLQAPPSPSSGGFASTAASADVSSYSPSGASMAIARAEAALEAPLPIRTGNSGRDLHSGSVSVGGSRRRFNTGASGGPSSPGWSASPGSPGLSGQPGSPTQDRGTGQGTRPPLVDL